jgi:DNA replication and repair protein RecF
MYIESVVLKNFRNYTQITIPFIDGINILTGENGIGKTNILEALSVLGSVKSFRKASDKSMVQLGSNSYYTKCIVNDNDKKNTFEVGFSILDGLKKKCKINLETIDSFNSYYGKLLLIISSPNDLLLIDGVPDFKRKYIDSVIAKYNEEYINILSKFRRVLNNRNKLLKKGTVNTIKNEITAWDSLFSHYAEVITVEREKIITQISTLAEYYFRLLSSTNNSIEVRYYNNCNVTKTNDVLTVLQKNLTNDLHLRTTSKGPQRDTYEIFINGNEFKSFASQGQKRIMSIAIKLAEKDIVEEQSFKRVVLCLDDVFSELDKKRRSNLLSILGDNNQVIITVVEKDIFDLDSIKKLQIIPIQ